MIAPKDILDLTERFERNRDSYHSGNLNEEQVRVEYINPFFDALGWDIGNIHGYAEPYKDVIHEDAIKVGEATKAPDYCFRIGGTRKFFLEAKRPSVAIKDDVHPAYQLRRYAWTAKLPLSVLTNFEEFAVYDCRVKPSPADKSSTARILCLNYTEYAPRWNEVVNVFSRDAVLKGLFDKFAESNKVKKGTADVDDEFLKEIESWRHLLACHLALRNSKLTQRELNFSVSRTIDRIIFLRICEGRGIETYGRLQSLLNGTRVYPRLCEFFHRADERYNSGLFHFQTEKDRTEAPDELTLGLSIDDKPLKDIIENLYYPKSPYAFSALSADVLGQVYEQFLGKVIRLTAGHQARVEDKPEVKKAGGVYYTPPYISDYIVKNTVGKLLEGKTPKQVSKLSILDPACGSGSFLICAYQCLLDWHCAWYEKDGSQKHTKELYQGAGGVWKLTSPERKRILLNNIFGVDIDAQAVETTKLSLLLKVLEGENEQTISQQLQMFHQRALPDLSSNIKCGNSLIGPDYYHNQQLTILDEEERIRINVFDWTAEFHDIMKSGGFDVVIGNPPYDVMEKERGASSWPHSALAEYAKSLKQFAPALGGKLNLFRFFIVQSLQLSKYGGRFGMIVPLALLADISCAATRKHLLLSTSDMEADCFPQKDNVSRRVFKSAKLSTVVISAGRSGDGREDTARFTVRVHPWNSFTDKFRQCALTYREIALLDPENVPVPLVDNAQWNVCCKLHSNKFTKALGHLQDFEVNRGEINQTIYRDFITQDSTKARLLKGVEIGRYQIHKELKQGCREWFDEERFISTNNARPNVYVRRIATQRITGVDEKLRIVATLVEPPTYFADSTNSVVKTDGSPYRFEYLLGMLNSKLFQWRFKLTSTNNNVATNELKAMPFRVIDFDDSSDKAAYGRMVGLVETMLALQAQRAASRTPAEQGALDRQIAATDTAIDTMVYDLYDLTDDEREIIGAAGT